MKTKPNLREASAVSDPVIENPVPHTPFEPVKRQTQDRSLEEEAVEQMESVKAGTTGAALTAAKPV